LQDDKEKIIGLGSGLTLKKALQRIDFDSLNTRCVALISAMNADGQCNYYDDVPLLLTRKIKAKYYQWTAPRYAQSAD
ncbi:cytochrome C biogenesis protein CcdA, partial [Acinetobacter baumannii]|uniref:sugar-binding domain-containing protein n=1 Tax=Acinetobacter baumannii TaxID=470 RepID=UPI0028929227